MTEKSAEFQLGKIAELLKRQDALAARREYLAAAALDSEIQKLKAKGVPSSESRGAGFVICSYEACSGRCLSHSQACS